jgi:hypothetical protein
MRKNLNLYSPVERINLSDKKYGSKTSTKGAEEEKYDYS